LKKCSKFTVQTETSLLPFLRECFPAKSRNHVKGLLTRGQIHIDGKQETHYAKVLLPGQVVEVLSTAPEADFEIGFPIIFEDDDILVIDKPQGMLSISTDKERERTAYHIITDYVKFKNDAARIFIVHRLDRDTSGIMLFAKNEQMKQKLQENWESLVSYRGYVAVVEGMLEKPEGQIVSWLKQTRTLVVYSSKLSGDGKKAVTNYKTITSGGAYSLLQISLETGRKNQIRVHMKEMGHPIAGDKKYGAAANPLNRLALHANCLALTNPISGESMRFESDIPSGFLQLVN